MLDTLEINKERKIILVIGAVLLLFGASWTIGACIEDQQLDERGALILAEIERYLARRKRAALIDLARHLDSDPDALRGMLGMLERKGRVRRLPAGTICGDGCLACDPATIEIFEWVD